MHSTDLWSFRQLIAFRMIICVTYTPQLCLVMTIVEEQTLIKKEIVIKI
jgi:hypothetical protein